MTWKMKKNYLCKLIKSVSHYHGGDDIEWLREYCRLVIQSNRENIDAAIDWFVEECLRLGIDVERGIKSDWPKACPICAYVRPFCDHHDVELKDWSK